MNAWNMILLIEEASIFSGFGHGALWSAVYNFPSSCSCRLISGRRQSPSTFLPTMQRYFRNKIYFKVLQYLVVFNFDIKMFSGFCFLF